MLSQVYCYRFIPQAVYSVPRRAGTPCPTRFAALGESGGGESPAVDFPIETAYRYQLQREDSETGGERFGLGARGCLKDSGREESPDVVC